MHRTKKITVTATAVALFMAAGMSSAMATRTDGDGNDQENHKITICHATHSEQNPYVRINVSENAAEAHEHHGPGHEDDIFFNDDANVKQCPAPPGGGGGGGGDDEDEGCVASSTSGDSTQSQDGLINVGNLNLGLNNLLANTGCHASILDNLTAAVLGHAIGGDVDGSGDGDCSAESTSRDSEQEQEGLVNVGNINVGLDNLGANTLCGASLLNNVTAAVLGHATGGDVDGSGDGDCSAESTSRDSDQDQDGAINVGNINVGGDNLLANLACGASVLDNPTVAVLGSALGGSTLGTGLVAGPAGILSGAPGFLLSGLTTDVSVVASALLYL